MCPYTLSYPPTHLLGAPQEIRDRIFQLIDEDIGNSCAKSLENLPITGYEALPLICKQLYLETSTTSDWLPRTRIVHHKQVGPFLDWVVYNTPAIPKLQSLTIELPHDGSPTIFSRLAKLLQHDLTGLQELKILGVGADCYGEKTSWRDERCGKHDTSTSKTSRRKLLIEGQEWQRRIAVINSLQWLSDLEVLVIDHFNLPVTQTHVLKNKQRLRRLRIGADARSILHGEMRPTLGVLGYPLKESAPALKEVNLCANGVLSAYGIIEKVAETLEKFTYTVPDSYYQTSGRINFLGEASMIFGTLGRRSKKLRELRVCIHGGVYEIPAHGNFIMNFKLALQRMSALKVLEMHIHLESQWLASEFIQAVPPSVQRLYISDQFFCRSRVNFTNILSWHCCLPGHDEEIEKNLDITKEMARGDFILRNNDLEFIEYEFHSNLTSEQRCELRRFLKLNGRLLERSRNKQLCMEMGQRIQYAICEETALSNDVWEDAELLQEWQLPTFAEVDAIRKDLEQCGLKDTDYFGMEDSAQAIFNKEPPTKAIDLSPVSYPHIVVVESEGVGSEHWLSG